jgi:hypothetical protein
MDIIVTNGMREGARPLTSSNFFARDDFHFQADEFCVGSCGPGYVERNESVKLNRQKLACICAPAQKQSGANAPPETFCTLRYNPPPAPLARSGGVSQLSALWP